MSVMQVSIPSSSLEVHVAHNSLRIIKACLVPLGMKKYLDGLTPSETFRYQSRHSARYIVELTFPLLHSSASAQSHPSDFVEAVSVLDELSERTLHVDEHHRLLSLVK